MSDTINLTDQFAGFNFASIFERFERAEENNPQQTEQADETARPGRGRGLLRAAFAQRRGRARSAFFVELSQQAREAARGRETREAEGEEEPGRAAQPREPAPQGRAALRQQLQQAMQAFRQANQPMPAGGGGEERRGVVTIPVGLERGARQGGGAAAGPAPAGRPERPGFQVGVQPATVANREPPPGRPERPGFQVGTQPATVANREPPRLDGVRMAASFEQTALGNALNVDRGPTNLVTGRANAPDGPAFGRGGQPAQGPLAHVQRRLESPGNNLLDTDQRSPLDAGRVALQGRVGANQLEQRPPVGQMNPGAPEPDNAPRAGVGAETINRATGQAGQANAPGNNLLDTDQRSPLDADRLALQGRVGANQLEQRPLVGRVNPGAAGEPAGGIGGNVRPAAMPAPGVAPPANPLEPQQPALLNNEPAAPLQGGAPNQAAPALDVLQAALEPEQPAANPPPPAPEPPETPGERAAAIRMTPAEAADEELRAAVPAPIEPPPGAAAPGAPAPPPGPAEAGRPLGATETAQAPRAGVPVEPGAEEEGAGVAPPEVAPPGEAEGGAPRAGIAENPANEAGPLAPPGEEAGPAERPPAREQEGLEARATAAYEQQQMENRTNEPNERRTVMEMFIR